MPLQWDVSRVIHSDAICFTMLDPEEAADDFCLPNSEGTLYRLNPLTRAIILSTVSVGLNAITPLHLEEYQYRLDALFDAGVYFWYGSSPEGQVPLRIGRRHLVQHIGLTTSAATIPNSRFDAFVRQLRLDSLRDPEFPSTSS